MDLKRACGNCFGRVTKWIMPRIQRSAHIENRDRFAKLFQISKMLARAGPPRRGMHAGKLLKAVKMVRTVLNIQRKKEKIKPSAQLSLSRVHACIIIGSLFWLDFYALFSGRFEYLQKRIFDDLHESVELGKIYEGLYDFRHFLAYNLPAFCYTNFAQRSFSPQLRGSPMPKKGLNTPKSP